MYKYQGLTMKDSYYTYTIVYSYILLLGSKLNHQIRFGHLIAVNVSNQLLLYY